MQKVCPNCGDPVDQDEIFCDKCGTKVGGDAGVQNQYQIPTPNAYQTPVPNVNQNQYQTPAPNPYQNQYQTPVQQTPNAYQNQYQTPPASGQTPYSYVPGQQGVPPYQTPYNQYPSQKPANKNTKFIIIGASVVAVLLVVIGLIALMGSKDDKPVSNNKPTAAPTTAPTAAPSPTGTKPTIAPTQAPKPTEAKPTVAPTQAPSAKPSSGKSQAAWDAKMNANTTYSESEKRINVEYKVTLTNVGTVDSQNINLYMDPAENDENAKYLGVKPKTVVNYEQGIIKEIKTNGSFVVSTKFFYDNIEPAKATQQLLQDIANRYIKMPLYIEWEEKGVKYNAKMELK